MRRLRERRATALVPIDGQAPRAADELLSPAVAETLAALDLKPEDEATAQLARRYAKVIDEARDPAWACRWLSPLLLDALCALGATPAARHAMTKGQRQAPAGSGGLAALRAARRGGPNGRPA